MSAADMLDRLLYDVPAAVVATAGTTPHQDVAAPAVVLQGNRPARRHDPAGAIRWVGHDERRRHHLRSTGPLTAETGTR